MINFVYNDEQSLPSRMLSFSRDTDKETRYKETKKELRYFLRYACPKTNTHWLSYHYDGNRGFLRIWFRKHNKLLAIITKDTVRVNKNSIFASILEKFAKKHKLRLINLTRRSNISNNRRLIYINTKELDGSFGKKEDELQGKNKEIYEITDNTHSFIQHAIREYTNYGFYEESDRNET